MPRGHIKMTVPPSTDRSHLVFNGCVERTIRNKLLQALEPITRCLPSVLLVAGPSPPMGAVRDEHTVPAVSRAQPAAATGAAQGPPPARTWGQRPTGQPPAPAGGKANSFQMVI